VYIEISDNGKGIQDIEQAKMPLFTTKPTLERSGMGFTIMESFMDDMYIESVVGVGTKIIMKKLIKQTADKKEMCNL
jgi:stage II sporulation protein AB (anti-sigma F factor)